MKRTWNFEKLLNSMLDVVVTGIVILAVIVATYNLIVV